MSATDSSSPVIVTERQGVLTVCINPPRQHNALTEAMYDTLRQVCERARNDTAIRCLVLRGTPGAAFASGTDIARFRTVRDGDDGIAYELAIEGVRRALLDVSIPTLAVIEGYALGGGLMIATACDLRVATPVARFGVLIARTLGNCLSQSSYDLLADRVGASMVLRMLLLGTEIDAEEAHSVGFLAILSDSSCLDDAVAEIVGRVLGNAPLTMWAGKRADRNRRAGRTSDDDLIRCCYGSQDFSAAVAAFGSGRRPSWLGT